MGNWGGAFRRGFLFLGLFVFSLSLDYLTGVDLLKLTTTAGYESSRLFFSN